MNSAISLTQRQLADFLLHVALVRPVFIWGPPGIGKSALVQQFAADLGLDCVSLLGSQLAPEDLIGVPQIVEGVSRFCPPAQIARSQPYCLFLDELNACSHEVQKAFYSLIHERRIGEYHLPAGSIVIAAGNRAQDSSIVKTMSAALLNRLVHVQLRVAHRDWMQWALASEIHPLVVEYLQNRPDHLWSPPPKTEEPFSTPRSWHMLSDALHAYGRAAGRPSGGGTLSRGTESVPALSDGILEALAYGCLSPGHAGQFKAFCRHLRGEFRLGAILRGDSSWPDQPADRDVLYFLAQSFRAQLLKELPDDRDRLGGSTRELAFRGKALLKDLAAISLEIAQMVVAKGEQGESLPAWFLLEVVRDLPRLVEQREKKP